MKAPLEFSVRGKRVTVMGAARSGIAAALLLVTRGAVVTLSDMRRTLDRAEDEASLRAAGILLELGGHVDSSFASADLIVVSPGVPLTHPQLQRAREAGVPVIGEIELASRWLSGRIVAITGTKGKSTTTTLTGRMFDAGGLKALVGGNIGTPLSAQVADSTPDTFHIVEVSSFQLEATETFHPWIAVFLNFSPDHLDHHASIEEYAAAKAKIFANQDRNDWAVINADDSHTAAAARQTKGRAMTFSMKQDSRADVVIKSNTITDTRDAKDVPLVPVPSIHLIGRHLVADVMAAAAVARIAGVPPDAMVTAVESFNGLEHALEPVMTISGVRFVNDSKATNLESAQRAIESFDNGLVVILGGRFKGGDWAVLAEPLASRHASVIAIGESQDAIVSALGSRVAVHRAANLFDGVRQAFTIAPLGGTVLLSPACASFDMFRDYAERGRMFKLEVQRLAEEASSTREQ